MYSPAMALISEDSPLPDSPMMPMRTLDVSKYSFWAKTSWTMSSRDMVSDRVGDWKNGKFFKNQT